MPNRCVVEGCSNVANPAGGISLHFIPFAGDKRPEAKRRRKQWVDFVHNKREKWEPTPNTSVCSAHFAKEDFHNMFATLSTKKPPLIFDKIGVVAIPNYMNPDNRALSARDKRKGKKFFEYSIFYRFFEITFY